MPSSTANEALEQEQRRIAERAYQDGRAAGSWVTDGNTTTGEYKRLLAGIEAGDPEVLDRLPEPRLGGEWAGDPTWSDILEQEGCGNSDDMRDDLYDLYCEQFARGVEDEITSTCTRTLESKEA